VIARRVARRPKRGAGHAAERRGTRPVGCAIVTCSDTRRGARDLSGNAIARLITCAGHRVARRAWVSDDRAAIRRAARAALAERRVDVLIVTGSTGVAARDVTPEALAPLIDRPLPGFGELFRVLSMREVGAAAWLSRAAAGVARGRLVFMLPGSTSAVSLAMRRLIVPELVHLVRMLGRLPMES
jgi:molybdenum cofactor biosynthesis protein B